MSVRGHVVTNDAVPHLGGAHRRTQDPGNTGRDGRHGGPRAAGAPP